MSGRGSSGVLARVEVFAKRLGVEVPVLLAPMSGACPSSLSIAVANAGGMGACGALLMEPQAIAGWAAEFRAGSAGPFQINLWIPEKRVRRDADAEGRQRVFLGQWGPVVTEDDGTGSSDSQVSPPQRRRPVAGDPGEARPGAPASAPGADGLSNFGLPDFAAQCAAVLEARPTAISSIMGVFPPDFVVEMKKREILWLATATTAEEARVAEAAGADAVIAQGMEAGGHRGAFDEVYAEAQMVGLFALVPQVCDAVSVPVIAAGGIGDGRGVAAALMLGASAVVVGTGFLRAPEAKLHASYAERIGQTEAHQTRVTRAYSGRAARGVGNVYVEASAREVARPAAYPVQRGLTKGMREEAVRASDVERMQMWAGQAGKLARAESAGVITRRLWDEGRGLLG